MTIRNLAEAEAALRPYVPLVSQLMGKDLTLRRVEPLMKLIGNPEKRLRIIHIAGTSGKTSTAYYMSALLTEAGCKVGLTISPHVDRITERTQINGQPLSESDFCRELGEFMELVKQVAEPPSYFELLYAFAMWVFERHNVDYAVIETGVGGLYDATNVASRRDKICIITDIGLDHMAILGNTLPEIATQKIGIVHPGNQVFTYQQPTEVMRVFEHWTSMQLADLHIVDEPKDKPPKSMPAYQFHNWQLALAVYEFIAKQDKLPHLTSQVLQKTQAIKVPARLEVRKLGNKTIVMDGAHNQQKMQAFIDSFRQLYPNTKPLILLALREGKDYQAVVPDLSKLTDHIIVTTFETTQDLPAKSIDPHKLARALANAGVTTAEVVADQHQAFQASLASVEPIIIITGSFYLLSQLRNNEKLA